MCFNRKPPAPVTPAPAPEPAEAPAETVEIGSKRRKETMDNFGSDAPNYRVDRPDTTASMNPNNPITM